MNYCAENNFKNSKIKTLIMKILITKIQIKAGENLIVSPIEPQPLTTTKK